MADQISLGKNGNIGKLDLNRIKAGIKKEELAKNDPRLESVFDMVDKNKDGVLDRGELDDLQQTLGNLAGDDGNLEKKEVKNFDGQKLGRKDRKALAAEGDMSKYSSEFKQILKEFGMPEWMFKIQ